MTILGVKDLPEGGVCDRCGKDTVVCLDDIDYSIDICADCLAEICKAAGWEVRDESSARDSFDRGD